MKKKITVEYQKVLQSKNVLEVKEGEIILLGKEHGEFVDII